MSTRGIDMDSEIPRSNSTVRSRRRYWKESVVRFERVDGRWKKSRCLEAFALLVHLGLQKPAVPPSDRRDGTETAQEGAS